MLVEIKEGSMLGPFFSRYVKEHCGENSMWPVAKKMLLLSASIGASIRKHCSMSIAPADLAGAVPIFTRRRIRFHIDPSVQIELFGYLNKHTEGMGESLIWLAELHAASVYGSVTFTEPAQVSGIPPSARTQLDADAKDLQATSPEQSKDDGALERVSQGDSDPIYSAGYEVEPSETAAKGDASGVVSSRDEPLSKRDVESKGAASMEDTSSEVTHGERVLYQDNEDTLGLDAEKTSEADKDDPFSFLAEMAEKSNG